MDYADATMTSALKTLPDLLASSFEKYDRRLFVDEWTYSQFTERVIDFRNQLDSLGVKSGDRVILCHPSGADWLAAFFGITSLGAACVNVHHQIPPHYLSGVLLKCHPKAWVGGGRGISSFEPMLGSVPKVLPENLPRNAYPRPQEILQSSLVYPEHVAVLALTSGSTGNPRLVSLSHENLIENLKSLIQFRSVAADTVALSVLPQTHMFELMVGQLVPMYCGAHIHYAASIMPNRLVESIALNGVTHVLLVPALFQMIFRECVSHLADEGIVDQKWMQSSDDEILGYMRSEADSEGLFVHWQEFRRLLGSHFKTVVLGGAAGNPLWGEMLGKLGLELDVGYGLTEASPVVSLGGSRAIPFGSVGHPLPGVDVRISESGEILVRGKNVMKAYFQDEAATQGILADGWLHTGDVGFLDKEGHLFINGRIKETMVNEEGETLYPDEVEPFYRDAVFGEYCVVPFPGSMGNDIPLLVATPADSLDKVSERFRQCWKSAASRYKVKGLFLINTPFPRTALGKIKRREIATALMQREGSWEKIQQNKNFVKSSGNI